MTRVSDRNYYVTRLRAERAAADSASCPKARNAHRELADHYQQLLSASGDPETAPDDAATAAAAAEHLAQ